MSVIAENAECSVPDCTRPSFAFGWCHTHYMRWYRNGHITTTRTASGEPHRHLQEVILPYDGDECITWPYGKNTHGYGVINTHDGRQRIVSRLVCEIAHGKPPTPKHHAAHSCGNGHLSCVTKRHLSWKTPKENHADKIEHGTILAGEFHPRAMLTDEEVCEIRALRGRMSQREIARKFGTTQSYISEIHLRKKRQWPNEALRLALEGDAELAAMGRR